jgi:hypothetical protein
VRENWGIFRPPLSQEYGAGIKKAGHIIEHFEPGGFCDVPRMRWFESLKTEGAFSEMRGFPR